MYKTDWQWPCKTKIIQFYSNEQCTAFGVYIESNINPKDFKNEIKHYEHKFQVEGTEWSLALYPFGDVSENKDFLSLHYFLNKSYDDKIPFHIRMACSYKEAVSKNETIFNNKQKSWGFSKFKLRDEYIIAMDTMFFCNRIIKSHTLNLKPNRVKCDPWFVPDTVTTKRQDIKLIGVNWECWTHQEILEENSSVFKSMFFNDTKENCQKCIEMPDCDKDIIVLMLKFLYTGQIYTENTNKYIKLAQLANKYNIVILKLICDQFLSINTSKINVCKNILIAEMYDLKILNAVCLELIKNNYTEIVRSNHWKEVIKDEGLILKITREIAEFVISK